jgi:hypothetical protein
LLHSGVAAIKILSQLLKSRQREDATFPPCDAVPEKGVGGDALGINYIVLNINYNALGINYNVLGINDNALGINYNALGINYIDCVNFLGECVCDCPALISHIIAHSKKQ